MKENLASTKEKLFGSDSSGIENLTKQKLLGDLLDATIFSYFALNNIQDDLAAQQLDIISYRMPSYGKFSSSLSTSYWFGMPRNVSASGLVMDVDRVLNSTVDVNNDANNRILFTKMAGYRYSAMEHLVPEQMFSSDNLPAEAISAVKAIAIASSEGQKIWSIDEDNVDLALGQMQLSTEIEIRNSVNSGKVVTAHEKSINFNGWIGEGYIILDPSTGAGAYKIAGGANGGLLEFLTVLGLATAGFVMAIAIAFSGGLLAFALGSLIFLWELINFNSWVEGMRNARNQREFSTNNLIATVGAIFGLMAAFTPVGLVFALGAYFTFLIGLI